jgi:hypothetical protein
MSTSLVNSSFTLAFLALVPAFHLSRYFRSEFYKFPVILLNFSNDCAAASFLYLNIFHSHSHSRLISASAFHISLFLNDLARLYSNRVCQMTICPLLPLFWEFIRINLIFHWECFFSLHFFLFCHKSSLMFRFFQQNYVKYTVNKCKRLK